MGGVGGCAAGSGAVGVRRVEGYEGVGEGGRGWVRDWKRGRDGEGVGGEV